MPDRQLLKLRDGNTILSATAAEVPKGTDCDELIFDMLRVMRANDGMGLAAPQIGESVRVIVGESKNDGWRFVLINPTIKRTWGGDQKHDEGCLSVCGSIKNRIKISRPKCIQVRGWSPQWEQITVRGTHWMSWCLQHELQHLDGITIYDHASRAERAALL